MLLLSGFPNISEFVISFQMLDAIYFFLNIILVAGSWSKWNVWSLCTTSCGDGTQTRNRSCTDPSPRNGGANCTGVNDSSRNCKIKDCPGEKINLCYIVFHYLIIFYCSKVECKFHY